MKKPKFSKYMKANIALLFIAGIMMSCAGNSQKQEAEATPEMQALEQSTQDISTESESLDQQMDSLINQL